MKDCSLCKKVARETRLQCPKWKSYTQSNQFDLINTETLLQRRKAKQKNIHKHTSLVPGLVLTVQLMRTLPSSTSSSGELISSFMLESSDVATVRLSISSYHCWATPTCIEIKSEIWSY